jgi:hypothetical protein
MNNQAFTLVSMSSAEIYANLTTMITHLHETYGTQINVNLYASMLYDGKPYVRIAVSNGYGGDGHARVEVEGLHFWGVLEEFERRVNFAKAQQTPPLQIEHMELAPLADIDDEIPF